MKRKFIYILALVFFQVDAQSIKIQFADSLYATGNYINAINQYSKIGTEKASLQIARAYNDIGNFEKAITQYVALVSENSTLGIAKFELAKLYLKTRKYSQAKELLSILTAEFPKNPEYYFYIGETIRENKDLDLAIPSYKKAIAVDSTHLRSLFQLSKFYLVKRAKDSVIYYTNMGLSFYPKDVSLLNFKGLAYFNNDNFREAIPYFEKLIDLGEHKPFIYQKLGYAYYKTWEFEKAKNLYKMAISMEVDNSELYYELGHVYLKDRAMDSAKTFIQRAIELKKPNLANEYETLASIARQQEKLRESLRYYRLAHGEARDEPRYYYQICALYDQLVANPEKKLEYYNNFVKMYGETVPYISEIVSKRISELKTQIHFSRN